MEHRSNCFSRSTRSPWTTDAPRSAGGTGPPPLNGLPPGPRPEAGRTQGPGRVCPRALRIPRGGAEPALPLHDGMPHSLLRLTATTQKRQTPRSTSPLRTTTRFRPTPRQASGFSHTHPTHVTYCDRCDHRYGPTGGPSPPPPRSGACWAQARTGEGWRPVARVAVCALVPRGQQTEMLPAGRRAFPFRAHRDRHHARGKRS